MDALPNAFWAMSCLSSKDTGSVEDDFRWWLGRITTAPGKPRYPGRVIYVMLNPSVARGINIGDPTQRKCHGFTVRLGYGAYGIVNLFAYSTPYPDKLFEFGYEHAIGRHNDEAIRRVFARAKERGWPVVVAWGAPNLRKQETLWVYKRAGDLISAAKALELPLYALAETDSGHPRHPLMLGYDQASFKPWSGSL